MTEIRTERLVLRQWQKSDLAAFALLNADPEVMRYFPALLSRSESDAIALRCQDLIAERGWGFWAAQELETKTFIGFMGLHIPAAALPCSPCVEIGWRLAKPHWHKGFATEGAKACLEYAFQSLNLPEVVSFTSIHNANSEAVMKRLGMRRDPSTFAHPSIPQGHWLSEHCLYRLAIPQ